MTLRRVCPLGDALSGLPPIEDLSDLDAISGRYLVTDDEIRTAAQAAIHAMAELSLIMAGVPIPRDPTNSTEMPQ